jgi:hypothetical protein
MPRNINVGLGHVHLRSMSQPIISVICKICAQEEIYLFGQRPEVSFIAPIRLKS